MTHLLFFPLLTLCIFFKGFLLTKVFSLYSSSIILISSPLNPNIGHLESIHSASTFPLSVMLQPHYKLYKIILLPHNSVHKYPILTMWRKTTFPDICKFIKIRTTNKHIYSSIHNLYHKEGQMNAGLHKDFLDKKPFQSTLDLRLQWKLIFLQDSELKNMAKISKESETLSECPGMVKSESILESDWTSVKKI